MLTLNPILALATLGVEALWLLHAPESKTAAPPALGPALREGAPRIEAREREERMKVLPAQAAERVEALVARQEEIHRLAAQNPSFTGDLLRSELVKTAAGGRVRGDGAHLRALRALPRERRPRRSSSATASATRSGAAAGSPAGARRREEEPRGDREAASRRWRRSARYLRVARGQLDLIENSFQLIADQIVTMQSPQELTGQLDELLDGVESIRQTALDTEKILSIDGGCSD